MKIIENICKESDCYKAGRTIEVKGLMIHSVGCPQPKAQAFINNWNKPGVSACVHAIVEPDGDVYQLLPWNHRGWHGGGLANNTHIGVEMTEPDTIRYTGGARNCRRRPRKATVLRLTIRRSYQRASCLNGADCLQSTWRGTVTRISTLRYGKRSDFSSFCVTPTRCRRAASLLA